MLAYHYSKTSGLKTSVDANCWKNLENWERINVANWTDKKYDWDEITQYATKNKIPLTLDTIKTIIPMLLKTMFS